MLYEVITNLMDRDNYAGIAAEAMYGESFELNAGEGNDVLRMFDVATEQQNRYSFALFAADMSADAARASALRNNFVWHTLYEVIRNAYKMYGLIGFARGDAIYGNGFKGELNATFGGNITVEATALFGMVNTTRYFFVDAAFALKPGLPAGPMTIFGFSGGLYYHMARLTTEYSSQYRFGQTQSGKVYTPNASSGIGIMAGVKLALGSEQTINGDLV